MDVAGIKGIKNAWIQVYFYGIAYHRSFRKDNYKGGTTVDTTQLIYYISYNAGKSCNTEIEVVIHRVVSDKISLNINLNGFYNKIMLPMWSNQYPVENTFTADQHEVYS